jgi:hypothetical protein
MHEAHAQTGRLSFLCTHMYLLSAKLLLYHWGRGFLVFVKCVGYLGSVDTFGRVRLG